jgi:hypothetical protein
MNAFERFAKNHNIRMSCTMVDGNPNMDSDTRMDHYKCTIKRPGKQITLYYSMGIALCREPGLADVLETLAMDASGIEHGPDFEEWAQEYGYDADSRSAERIYRAVERQYQQVKRFLGDTLMIELITTGYDA